MTDTDYSTEVQDVVDALNAVYENKQANKKDTLSGDYSSDTASYPTCKAVKAAYGTKVTSWSSTVSDSNVPSEKLVKDALDGKSGTGHGHATGEITNSTSLGNIGSNLTTQAEINSALNTVIGALKGTKFIEIENKPETPSQDTMGKLYIVTESGKVNVYYTKATTSGSTTTYSWEELDADILDSLVVNWSDVQNKPSFGTTHSDFAYGDHGHGYVSNTGVITETVDMAGGAVGTADKILISDTSDGNKIKVTSAILTSLLKNTASLPNIGSNLTSQAEINSAINSKFAEMLSTLEVVTTLPSLGDVDDGYMCIYHNTSANTSTLLYAVKPSGGQGYWINFMDTNSISATYSTKTNTVNEVKVFAGQLAEAINPSS